MSEKKNVYAVMGASGNIGQVVANELLKLGHEVRVLGRSAERLKPLTDRGGVPVVGNFDDVRVLTEAFRGADGAFTMLPPDYGSGEFAKSQARVGQAIVQAVQASGLKTVVNLSSLGAELESGTGPVVGLHEQEERLNAISGLNLVHLRPAYFMENLFWSIPTIHAMGMIATPLRADLAMPMIATQDIGLKASEFLASLSFQGMQVFELFGPRLVTMKDAASILGQAIGKPDLGYVQVSYEDASQAMVAGGMKPDIVALMMDLNRSSNEGRIKPSQKPGPGNQGRSTLEQFAKLFALAYGG